MKRLFVAGGLTLLLVTAAGYTQDAQDANKLIGSWRLMKAVYGGKPLNFGGQVEIKSVTDSQFIWFRHKEGSSTITDAGGGAYSVKGNTYSEKLEYGIGNDFKVVKGHVISLNSRVEGNTWHISGTLNNGLKIEEDWQKLPPERVVP